MTYLTSPSFSSNSIVKHSHKPPTPIERKAPQVIDKTFTTLSPSLASPQFSGFFDWLTRNEDTSQKPKSMSRRKLLENSVFFPLAGLLAACGSPESQQAFKKHVVDKMQEDSNKVRDSVKNTWQTLTNPEWLQLSELIKTIESQLPDLPEVKSPAPPITPVEQVGAVPGSTASDVDIKLREAIMNSPYSDGYGNSIPGSSYRDLLLTAYNGDQEAANSFIDRFIVLSKELAKENNYPDYRIFAMQLINIIKAETGGSFDPQRTNASSGCKGLIQHCGGGWDYFVAGKTGANGKSRETDAEAQLDGTFEYLRGNYATMNNNQLASVVEQDRQRNGLVLIVSIFTGASSTALDNVDTSTIRDNQTSVAQYVPIIQLKPEQAALLEQVK